MGATCKQSIHIRQVLWQNKRKWSRIEPFMQFKDQFEFRWRKKRSWSQNWNMETIFWTNENCIFHHIFVGKWVDSRVFLDFFLYLICMSIYVYDDRWTTNYAYFSHLHFPLLAKISTFQCALSLRHDCKINREKNRTKRKATKYKR